MLFRRPVYSRANLRCTMDHLLIETPSMSHPRSSLQRVLLATSTLVTATASAADSLPASPHAWVATWHASPQPVWAADFLFPTNVPAILHDQTVHQTARISLGGERMRLVFSNAYGTEPLILGPVTVAREPQGDAPAAPKPVTFGGNITASIPPGASLISDAVNMRVPSLARIVVNTYLPASTPVRTFHWDGRQTSWIVAGDQTKARAFDKTTPHAITTTARLLLSGIQVDGTATASTIAIIGDSITDGATASLDTDHRWPDYLAARLTPHGVAVINTGISGGRLLSDGMGVNVLARLDRDVLAQPGIKSIIVLIGINDIAWPGTAFARTDRRPTLTTLTSTYRQLVEQAHARGLRVMGATLTPFEGALPDTPLSDYYQADKDALRQQVNAWIRESGTFDAVVDFDAVLRDPGHPKRLAVSYDSGDHLHPGDEGNRVMADAVILDALLPPRP